MTTGFALMLAATLGLFILAGLVSVLSGLWLDAAFDKLARSLLGFVWGALFFLPTGLLWFAFWHFGDGQ